MNSRGINQTGLRDIRRSFTGRILTQDDVAYDSARRLFSSKIDKYPGVIAQCRTVDDVVAAVRFGRNDELLTAIRSGGHSLSGTSTCDDGLVIDVRDMKDIEVDPDARTVRCGGGVTWGELDVAAGGFGLAVTGGRVSSTGVAGLTLGGGSGWLERKFGLTCDNLVSAELVTASGDVVQASATSNPELFWALHGGGGNFGVATALELRLHPLGPSVLAGLMLWPASHGREVLVALREMMETAPDEVGVGFLYLTAPTRDFVPEQLRGTPAAGLAFVYAGLEEEGQAYAQVLRNLRPAVDMVAPRPYTEFQSMIDDPSGLRYFGTTDYLADLSNPVIDVFIEQSEAMPLGLCQSAIVPWGGAVSRIGPSETPMTQRNAKWVTHPYALWQRPEDDERHLGWCREISQSLKPFATGGVYLNFIGDEGPDRVRAAFGDDNYARLVAAKNAYDPDNFFRLNQNIRPTANGGRAS